MHSNGVFYIFSSLFLFWLVILKDYLNLYFSHISNEDSLLQWVYGLKPEVWVRVGPDPQAELQVDPAQGPQAQGLGRSNIF